MLLLIWIYFIYCLFSYSFRCICLPLGE